MRWLVQVLLPHVHPACYLRLSWVCGSWRRELGWRFFRAACRRHLQRWRPFGRRGGRLGWRETWARLLWLHAERSEGLQAYLVLVGKETPERTVVRCRKRACRLARMRAAALSSSAKDAGLISIIPLQLHPDDALLICRGDKTWQACYIVGNIEEHAPAYRVNGNASRHHLRKKPPAGLKMRLELGDCQSGDWKLKNKNKGAFQKARIRY